MTHAVDAGRFNRVVKGAGRVVVVQQQSMEETYTNLLVEKLNAIIDGTSHPLHERLAGQLIVRSGRMRFPLQIDTFPLSFPRPSRWATLIISGVILLLNCNVALSLFNDLMNCNFFME